MILGTITTVLFSGLTIAEIVGIIGLLLIFLGGYVKIQKDISKFNVQIRELQNEQMELKKEINLKMPRLECERTHNSVNENINNLRRDIKDGLLDLKEDLKEDLRNIHGTVSGNGNQKTFKVFNSKKKKK